MNNYNNDNNNTGNQQTITLHGILKKQRLNNTKQPPWSVRNPECNMSVTVAQLYIIIKLNWTIFAYNQI